MSKESVMIMSTIEQLTQWTEEMAEFRLPRWEELPAFELYIDQVITLIEGYLSPLFGEGETIITSAMINNYANMRITPKAVKKRYGKAHLAYLIAISVLKQIYSIQEVMLGIQYQAEISGLKGAYNQFCEELEGALKAVHASLIEEKTEYQNVSMTKENTAIKLAALSLAGKLVSRKMLYLRHNKEEVENNG